MHIISISIIYLNLHPNEKDNLYTRILRFYDFLATTNNLMRETFNLQNKKSSQIAKVAEEVYELKNDSLIFKSSTIENFDKDGNSIDVYWIGNKKDTILRFYRKYDENKKLIGAEYYEEGDTEPSRDTVYTNSEGS